MLGEIQWWFHKEIMPPFTSIRRSTVPIYLHESEFYLSLDETDDKFSVPADCMKMDPDVECLSDLKNLLSTMRYWILKVIPVEAIAFMINSRNASVLEILNEFGSAFPRTRDLVNRMYESESYEPCHVAAKYGRVDFLDYFRKQRGDLDSRTMMIAAENGRVDCLSYCVDFLRLRRPFSLADCDWKSTVKKGNFRCLPYLVENGVSISKFLTLAIQCSSAKCVKYLHEQFQLDCWVPSTVAEAAGSGKLKLVKQLHKMGCPWDESAPIAALRADEAGCLQYLIEQRGVPTSSVFANITPNLPCAILLMQYQIKQLNDSAEKLNQIMIQTSGRVDRLFEARIRK